jgi:2-amino-4-hydroxy-6-hydroxymethyldihydropteridine diphosphokinase
VKSEGRSAKTESERQVFVALGSNLGDSVALVRRAVTRLAELSKEPLRCSSFWQTDPIDCPTGSPPFINAVVGFSPRAGETPESLLAKLQQLEREFGRPAKHGLNEPRPLDLDLLAFGTEQRAASQLLLPHPRARQRRFVLEPWAELAPSFVIPGQSETVDRLLAALGAQETVRKVQEPV